MEKIVYEYLKEIQERAEHDCDRLRRAGEKQGNYREIALAAKKAIKALGYAPDPWMPK